MSQPTVPDREAPSITCDEPGSFPWQVFHVRHPALIRRLLEALPYGQAERQAFAALLRESQHDQVAALSPEAPDFELWQVWGKEQYGRPWRQQGFLWSESYFYRRLLQAGGYFGDGGWRGVDLFAPFKHAELDAPAFTGDLAALDRQHALADGERERSLLMTAVWGNLADLGFTIAGKETGDTGALAADDSDRLWKLLDGGLVTVVADNSGRELLADLVLVDHLLAAGRAREVSLLVKPQPYYISDATPSDVLDCLDRMTGAAGAAPRIGGRLRQALRDDRLRLRAHPFGCAPLGYRDMPGDLREEFAASTVTIMKGDLNYRRLAGDRLWPPTTPFAEVTAYFPGPVAALRTVKSEVVTGLDRRTAAELEAADPSWRTSGTHAVIQVATPRDRE
ncbi:damage-control phosphatase ARMT1 family protein [Nonomuraea zeae]|uniref:Protein-glutamate O-methyltransferase family protein n=1 Tax=Nonomuraea zeae TaxID=1642303 RepID=A0A5S4GBM2_9ACTN|nr:damage-control phosphatase ARMT1 family protein [Nonomuraea zeae]TMR29871.1 protein-glutamate O-methyltransferase family protein [Nonomuraea zeae]